MLGNLLAALSLLAVSLQASAAEDNMLFSEQQPVRIAPLPVDQALAAFRDICMAGFPDPAAFDSAASASGLGFVKSEDPERGAQEWSSRHGQIVLRQAPNRRAAERRDRREGRAARERWQVRCDFWVAVDQPHTEALLAAISQQLAGGGQPVEEIIGASWNLGPAGGGGSLKLVYIPSMDDPHFFTLSLQRLADNPSR